MDARTARIYSPRRRARFCTGVRSIHLGTGIGSPRALQRPWMPPSPSVLPMRRSITYPYVTHTHRPSASKVAEPHSGGASHRRPVGGCVTPPSVRGAVCVPRGAELNHTRFTSKAHGLVHSRENEWKAGTSLRV